MRALAEYVMRGRREALLVSTIAVALPMFFWLGAAVVGLVLFEFGATCLERRLVLLVGNHGLAVRDQVVAAEAGAHLHLFTKIAEVAHLLKQNDFHRMVLVFVRVSTGTHYWCESEYGISARKRASFTARVNWRW